MVNRLKISVISGHPKPRKDMYPEDFGRYVSLQIYNM